MIQRVNIISFLILMFIISLYFQVRDASFSWSYPGVILRSEKQNIFTVIQIMYSCSSLFYSVKQMGRYILSNLLKLPYSSKKSLQKWGFILWTQNMLLWCDFYRIWPDILGSQRLTTKFTSSKVIILNQNKYIFPVIQMMYNIAVARCPNARPS